MGSNNMQMPDWEIQVRIVTSTILVALWEFLSTLKRFAIRQTRTCVYIGVTSRIIDAVVTIL